MEGRGIDVKGYLIKNPTNAYPVIPGLTRDPPILVEGLRGFRVKPGMTAGFSCF